MVFVQNTQEARGHCISYTPLSVSSNLLYTHTHTHTHTHNKVVRYNRQVEIDEAARDINKGAIGDGGGDDRGSEKKTKEEETKKGYPINVEGMMIGNGAIATGDWYEGWLTQLRNRQAFAHGLFSPSLYAHVQKTCTNYTKGLISPQCQTLLKQVDNETGRLNQYDIRQTCTGPRPHPFLLASYGRGGYDDTQKPLNHGRGGTGWTTAPGSSSNTSNIAAVEATVAAIGMDEITSSISTPEEDPCDLGATDLIRYMSRADVQRAIHVSESSAAPSSPGTSTSTRVDDGTIPTEPTGAVNWEDCGGSFGRPVVYTRIPQDERVTVYPELIGKMRILIFNGDQDNCIPYTQDEAWTKGMGLTEIHPWAPWKVVGGQIGGYAVRYEQEFTFSTVKGAGHMCPSTQPLRAHHMMMRFIAGQPL